VLATQTAAQSWVEGHAFSLALPAATFTDATALTYSATTASGQALPSWLTFNPTTRIFSGTAPATAQTLSLAVKATDSAGLSASETISVSIVPEISLRTQTAAQSWTAGQAVGVIVPASAFTDNAGAPMTFMAAETTGLNATSWLSFNPHTGELVGTVPAAAHGAFGLDIIASDASGMTATDFFTVSIAPAPGHAASTTPFASVSTLTPLPTTSMSLPLTHGA